VSDGNRDSLSPRAPSTGAGDGHGPDGRPVRKDELEIDERGIYIESWLPERRSRRRPLFLVHGELAGSWVWERYLRFFASRGWEGHAVNLVNHYWSKTADPQSLTFGTYLDDVTAGLERIGPNPVAIGHGLGGLLALKAAAERVHVAGLILLDAELPAPVRRPVQSHEVRDIPPAYGRDHLGWETLPEKLQRENRDLTLEDVLRIQHLLGQKARESGRAKSQVLAGVQVEPRLLSGVPVLVVGSGLDGSPSAVASERLATWLGAEHEVFGAHSHYGLIMGQESFRQVAERLKSFLEAHRL
jgi:pimeloyl-ACP methyl ester carboxylesterase